MRERCQGGSNAGGVTSWTPSAVTPAEGIVCSNSGGVEGGGPSGAGVNRGRGCTVRGERAGAVGKGYGGRLFSGVLCGRLGDGEKEKAVEGGEGPA